MNLARLLKRAEELGIDLPSHRCDCEVGVHERVEIAAKYKSKPAAQKYADKLNGD